MIIGLSLGLSIWAGKSLMQTHHFKALVVILPSSVNLYKKTQVNVLLGDRIWSKNSTSLCWDASLLL